jgi:dCTP deaminase
MIVKPFEEEILRENGLDLRLGNSIARLLHTSSKNRIFDSKKENLEEWYRIEYFNDFFVIYPRERLLCHTLEYLKLPNDIIGFCQLRSTFARMGLSIPPTIIDAGFQGQLTIEIIGSNFPIKLYVKQRLMHVIFHKLITPTTLPYKGKYQGQNGLTLPKLTET